MGKVFFVVERNSLMREVPVKYHDEIWRHAVPNIVYAYQLDDAAQGMSCTELFARYQAGKSLDALPPSNVNGHDFAGKY